MASAKSDMHAAEIAEAEQNLHVAEAKLIEIERLKKMEPSLRKEVEALTEKIEKLKSEQAFFGNKTESEASPVLEPLKRTDLFKTEGEKKDDERKKRLKLLSKKLRQIEDLKKRTDELDPNEKAKVAGERKVREEIATLERGEDYDPDAQETVTFPIEEDEKEKMAKGIKKKLTQIEKLKENDNLDAEAKAKVATEHSLRQQLEALEGGHHDVVIKPPPQPELADVIADEKRDVDKKLKAVNKKLDQIKKLKESGKELTAEEKAKVATESELKKQKRTLEHENADVDKKEQARVFERLGWQDESKGKKNKK